MAGLRQVQGRPLELEWFEAMHEAEDRAAAEYEEARQAAEFSRRMAGGVNGHVSEGGS